LARWRIASILIGYMDMNGSDTQMTKSRWALFWLKLLALPVAAGLWWGVPAIRSMLQQRAAAVTRRWAQDWGGEIRTTTQYRVQQVVLNESLVTDAGLEHLEELPNLSSLVLNLGRSQMDEYGRRRLSDSPVTDYGLNGLARSCAK